MKKVYFGNLICDHAHMVAVERSAKELRHYESGRRPERIAYVAAELAEPWVDPDGIAPDEWRVFVRVKPHSCNRRHRMVAKAAERYPVSQGLYW